MSRPSRTVEITPGKFRHIPESLSNTCHPQLVINVNGKRYAQATAAARALSYQSAYRVAMLLARVDDALGRKKPIGKGFNDRYDRLRQRAYRRMYAYARKYLRK